MSDCTLCNTSCILAIAFILASVFITFNMEKDKLVADYISKLNVKQRILYLDVATQRRNIYLTGFFLGFIIALFILFLIKKNFNKSKHTDLLGLCFAFAFTFVFSYFYYMLYPNKKSMVPYLDEKEDRDAWYEVYKVMQKYYHLGFVVGMIGVLLFCYFFVHKL